MVSLKKSKLSLNKKRRLYHGSDSRLLKLPAITTPPCGVCRQGCPLREHRGRVSQDRSFSEGILGASCVFFSSWGAGWVRLRNELPQSFPLNFYITFLGGFQSRSNADGTCVIWFNCLPAHVTPWTEYVGSSSCRIHWRGLLCSPKAWQDGTIWSKYGKHHTNIPGKDINHTILIFRNSRSLPLICQVQYLPRRGGTIRYGYILCSGCIRNEILCTKEYLFYW